jgi:hypothetical protein
VALLQVSIHVTAAMLQVKSLSSPVLFRPQDARAQHSRPHILDFSAAFTFCPLDCSSLPHQRLTPRLLFKMEDRHSVSNPRPLPGGGGDGVKDIPTWEVDIIRDGSVIVDTFVLNNEVLPPRKNKKGKVLWRLPKDLDNTVSLSMC